jgi:S1-C subfamily serine protease
VILEVEGRPLRRVAELLAALDWHAPGDTITLTILRDGARLGIAVTLDAGR